VKFRYKLSTLLVGVAILSTCLAVILSRWSIYREQRRVVRTLEDAGALVSWRSELTLARWPQATRWLGFDEIGGIRAYGDDAIEAATECESIYCVVLDRNGRTGEAVTDHGFKRLAAIRNLQALVIFDSDASDDGLEHVKSLGQLNDVTIIGNQFTDRALLHVSNVSGLRFLEVRSNQITSRGIAHLGRLRRLETLRIFGATIDASGIDAMAEMTSLRSLTLADVRLSSRELRSLEAMPFLRSLCLMATGVREEDIERLRKRMKGCDVYVND